MKSSLCIALFTLPLLAQEPVRYELRFPNAAHHEAEIRVTFSGVRQPVLAIFGDSDVLTPPREITLDLALEYIGPDELVEVTPKSIRLRKRYLTMNERKRSGK